MKCACTIKDKRLKWLRYVKNMSWVTASTQRKTLSSAKQQYLSIFIETQGQVVWRPISAYPGLYFNQCFFSFW